MSLRLFELYQRLCLGRPALTLALLAVLLGAAAWYAQDFRLDASADSLVLENDEDLRYYREIRDRYGAEDALVVTYQPDEDLFSRASLQRLEALSADLAALDAITGVTSLLNVPLIDSPRMTLTEIQQRVRTLSDPDTDPQLARREFLSSPLYRDLIINRSGDTTAMLLKLRPAPQAEALLVERQRLRRKAETEAGLSAAEAARLEEVEEAYRKASAELQRRTAADIAAIREVLDAYRNEATIFLGGVPMIASDMIDFVADDIRVFGIGIGAFLLVLLTLAFRSLRWVLIPAVICGASALAMLGLLGWAQWPVTVVSSNFISLMLIITLSLVVHLIVRYRELLALSPTAGQRELLRETLRSKMAPSLFTTATTVVSFASLVVSDIRPVIDFGLMMVWGVSLAFVLSVTMFPALQARLAPGGGADPDGDLTQTVTGTFAALVRRHGRLVLWFYVLLVVLGIVGISRLTVENRFIDYFKDDTEIYQGMVVIDKELGGTTPLDVILDAPPDFLAAAAAPAPADDDEFAGLPGIGGGDPITSGESYWWNSFALQELGKVHDYLDALPETGKVLSLATTADILTMLNGDQPLNSFFLNLVYQFLPAEVKSILIDPYLAPDGNQVRISIRVIDSDPNLHRDALLKKIRSDLVEQFDLAPEQVHLSGALVLYNNVLQSLVGSQVTTLVVVFAAIVLMFLALFRSLSVALIAVVPTLVAAGLILGLMGWLKIPLDIMTITIAAITIGIGVDNAIHYTHRFREESAAGAKPQAAMLAAHRSVGRAMYYTSIIVSLGFSILALSNFMPSIYFGLFTGLAMLLALVANLTLLPLLLMRFGTVRGNGAPTSA